jgi:hypothetical protein
MRSRRLRGNYRFSRQISPFIKKCYAHPMAEVIHKYIGKGKSQPTPEQEERDAAKAKLIAARARKEEALAIKRENEAREHRGELIARSEALRQASYIFVAIRQKLLGLPTLLARKLAGKTQHEMRMIIDAEVRGCLTELSDPAVVLRGYGRRRKSRSAGAVVPAGNHPA